MKGRSHGGLDLWLVGARVGWTCGGWKPLWVEVDDGSQGGLEPWRVGARVGWTCVGWGPGRVGVDDGSQTELEKMMEASVGWSR